MSDAGGPCGNVLAICGSNLTGELPFSVAVRTAQGAMHTAQGQSGERRDLATLCQEACKSAGLRVEQIDSLVVDVGPGSYVGLRVAVTFVRFLQQFGGAQAFRVCSLRMLAQHAAQTAGRQSGRIRCVLDARRGRYHTALFEVAGDAGLRELEAPAAVAPEDALRDLHAEDLVVMSAALAEKIGEQVQDRCTLQVATGVTAESLFEASPEPARAEDLEPRYLMASYAED